MPRLMQSYYENNDVLLQAKRLLGKVLVSTIDNKMCSAMIVETEAYRAPDDLGCHATKHGFTARTKTMYKRGGHCYVYKCYGIHDLFNVVTGDQGLAHAVLIRAVEPLSGKTIMQRRRSIKGPEKMIYNGPGKFTRAMGITTAYNGGDMTKPTANIYIEDHAMQIDESEILTGPRVGMGNIVKWKNVPWRFRIKGNHFTSKPDELVYLD